MSEALSQSAEDMTEDKKPGQVESSGHVPDKVPRVSIGMPVYNGENFLEQALDSLLAQTFGDFELIISDNGSTDRTEQICRNYAARDNRIRYFRYETNRGASWNFNHVFSLARGEYFKWAAHDDVCAPDFLEACVSALDRDPGVVLCFSRMQLVDGEGRPMQNYQTPITLLGSPRPYHRFRGTIRQQHHCCYEVFGLAHTAVLRQTSLLGNYIGSDLMLLAELALRGRFHEIPAYLFFNRDHPARSIRAHSIHDRSVWFDPKVKRKFIFPRWRWLWEYSRTVPHSELDRGERIHCYAQLVLWVGRHTLGLADDVGHAGNMLLWKISPRASELVSRIVRKGPRALFASTNCVQENKSQRKA